MAQKKSDKPRKPRGPNKGVAAVIARAKKQLSKAGKGGEEDLMKLPEAIAFLMVAGLSRIQVARYAAEMRGATDPGKDRADLRGKIADELEDHLAGLLDTKE